MWRIYYGDGSTFSSDDGAPEDAPSFGVICVVQPNVLTGRESLHGWDWFYYVPDDGMWWGSDIHGVLDRLLHNLPIRALKQGRCVSNPVFQEIMQRANTDPDFPARSGSHRGERPAASRPA